ncbi:MAG: hypothetical protein NVSMB4_04320 [Acidimicrobiales bacterium]
MPHTPRSSSNRVRARWLVWMVRRRVFLAVAGLVSVAVGIVPLFGDRPAGATVDHRLGYEATVEGWTSWYGSYGIDGLGATWCIDHGIPAPDASYGYRPTTVSDHTRDTTTAMAWMLGRFGPDADRVTAAAITLVLHDLAGATYPAGRLEVGRLAGHLAGFSGNEAAVAARAAALRADAVAHAGLEGPVSMTVHPDSGRAALIVRVVDRRGRPVAGAAATVAPTGSTQTGAGRTGAGLVLTDADGQARLTIDPARPGGVVEATIPDLTLTAFAPDRAVAQRVAVGRRSVLRTTVETPPTTTAPPTTSAARPLTAPPATAPPATAPPATAVSTTVLAKAVLPAPVVPATSPPTVAPPFTSPVTPVAALPSPAPAQLPFTGIALRSTVWCALGLLLMGAALVLGAGDPGPILGDRGCAQ